jgi:hypothetical protein
VKIRVHGDVIMFDGVLPKRLTDRLNQLVPEVRELLLQPKVAAEKIH